MHLQGVSSRMYLQGVSSRMYLQGVSSRLYLQGVSFKIVLAGSVINVGVVSGLGFRTHFRRYARFFKGVHDRFRGSLSWGGLDFISWAYACKEGQRRYKTISNQVDCHMHKPFPPFNRKFPFPLGNGVRVIKSVNMRSIRIKPTDEDKIGLRNCMMNRVCVIQLET
jgi:hypothetical protein